MSGISDLTYNFRAGKTYFLKPVYPNQFSVGFKVEEITEADYAKLVLDYYFKK